MKRQWSTRKPELQPRLTPSDLDIAWAAGIYEGEGSCIGRGPNKNGFGVSIAQKDPEMLYRMRDLFGGSVKEYPNDRGTNKNGNQPFTVFAWRVSGDNARVFLGLVYSYLTTRRKQQIDRTSVREFLDVLGSVPREGAYVFVAQYMTRHREERSRLSHEHKVEYQREFHEQHKSDPAYMQKRREQVRKWRAQKQIQKVVSIA